ncbi:unnamed protein product [Schistosoma margrebowiei]|uniref:Uncharacterized protein n=1 Tax=Schistosoma margrebowiei TaxID=48269 RepID=A0A183LBP4_9TREM|nr:unnamed protein product [Schistosoma margrebowiei]
MLCGISNSVSSHEIANTSTLTIKNHNHNRIHSEFPNNHFNKIHMLKTETGKRSPAGYSWVPNEKFGIRPQSLGLYQSNPMLHDQRGLGSNTNPSDSSHRPTILSPDISRKEDFNSKSYSKKRRGTFDNNNKNVTVPTSLVSPNITYNSNNTSKSEKFKTNLPYFHSSHPKKSTSRTSSRESIRERSPVKLFSAKETHFQNYNATGNARESYKYAAVVNKYKEKSQPISDETTKVSQTRSASTPSRNLPQDEDKNAKNVEFQKLHEPHLSSSQIKSHEANKLIKDDNNTQSLSKKNELQNVISPSIISQRTDHLNITFLATSDNNTPIWSTNPLPINALTNSSVARLCDLTDPADAFNSNKQNLTHDNYINNDLDEFTQLQSVYSQITHKQKTKQKCNLPNSNSAASSLSAGDDRTFCDSGISSSSYSKDSACTSPSDPNAYNPMPSLGINEWVSTCKIPCDKEPIFDSNCHQKPNQGIPLSKSSRIPSISKLTDRPKMNTSTEMVDSQPAFSTIQRTQRPKTVGKLICQSGKEITSVISQNNDIDSQSPSLKFNHDVNSLNKISQSAKHLCDNASRLYSTPSSSNAIISKRPNKIFINSTSDEVSKSETMNVKIHNDTDNTTTTSTTTNKTNTTTLNNANNYNHNCNINKDLRPDNFIKFEPSKSNETIDDIECNQLNQMYISNKMNKQHNHSHQQLKLSNDQQHKIFHNQSSVIISDCDKSKVKRDNGKSTILFDEPSLKITCNELGQLTDTREMNSYFKPCSRSGVIPRPRELFSLITSEKLVGDQKKSPDIKPIKSSVVTSEPEISLLSKSLPGVVAEDPYHKPADFTNDPDLLLSSLSKLSCDPCLEDNSWDQNYFSDVESEYAALELILPIPKRESLTEAEIALELDKKLSEAIPDQVSGAFVNIINPNTSLANNVVSSGKCLEPGYFSDTEAIFSSQRKFKPLSDPNNCKLPIASVAPIMSTQPAPFRNVLHENKKRLLAPNNINLKTNELSSPLQCTSKIDGMMQIQEIKWPRLCSLQNLVHSENKGRLRHSSNHHDAINKTSLRVTNCTISTGPLSQVKLPYPTASMMVNVGSLNDITAKSGGSHYEGQTKGIHNTHSELDQCRTSGKLLNGDLNGAASALNCPSIKSADLMIENFRQETKRLQDHITVLSSHLSVKRFYPNFYSYTKSHYEPLVSNLLIKSESEHSCRPNTNGDKICSNDNTINNIDKITSDWYSGIDCEKYSENSNINEQKHTITSSDINSQRMFKTKHSRDQLVDLKINESQRWARENSDPPKHKKMIDDETLIDFDSIRSEQSFISPYIKINEYLTSEYKVKQNANYGNIENNANNLISVSYNDIRCNIIPNYQHYPDLMSTSLKKNSSFIKRKSRSLHKQSNDHELHYTNHIDKTDPNTLFGNGNHSKRLPSPCVLLKTAQEIDKGPKVLSGHVQNTAISNYDLRPKRLIETERMVRQELATTRQKSTTHNNTISNNNSNIILSKDCHKLVKQTSPKSLKKSYFNEKKQIIRSPNKSKYIISDKSLSDDELHENNSTILINSRTNLSSKFENITTISNEMNYGNKSETGKMLKDSKIETLEETMENMVVRLEQLQAMDNFKNSEIHELQNIINQLRGDDMNSKSSVSSPSHFQPKPPRSTSCRTLPDAMYQDLQDAVSLNSFTSGTSAGSQDPSIHSQQQQQQKMNSKSDEKCSSQISRSPSALDTERSYVKHSHWLRASFSKAFKKRAKSNIRPNDSEILMNDNSTTNLQSTLHDQVTENNHKLQCEQQLDRLYLTVSRMRWQMDLLEARNKKLQEIILKYNPDEVLRNELYTVKLEKKVSLYDLSTHHFQDSCQFVQVFVHTESICQRNLDKISNTSQCRDQPAANNNSEDTPFNCIRSFKIGCTGLLDEMTWEDLDERLQKLLQV